MRIYENGVYRDATQQEIAEIEERAEKEKVIEKHRPFTQNEVFSLLAKQQINTLSMDDAMAVRMVEYYPTFEEIIGQTIEKKGFKFSYKGELFKTAQDNLTIQAHYPPEIGTESLYIRIDEQYDGTKYDPIVYKGNMELFENKYYTQNDVLYLCFRNTGIAVHQPLAEMVNVYVRVVNME